MLSLTVMRAERGMSLAEVIVAVGILGTLTAVAVGIFPFSHSVNQQAWDLVTAQQLGASQLEQLRGQPFDKLPASATATRTVRNVLFTCAVTTAAFGTQNPVNLKKCSAVVTWTTREPQTLTLDTLLVRTSAPSP